MRITNKRKPFNKVITVEFENMCASSYHCSMFYYLLNGCSSIKSLSLRIEETDTLYFNQIIESCLLLEELIIYNSEPINDEILMSISNNLKYLKCLLIYSFYIENDITNNGFHYLIKNSLQLNQLCLDKCYYINDFGLIEFSKMNESKRNWIYLGLDCSTRVIGINFVCELLNSVPPITVNNDIAKIIFHFPRKSKSAYSYSSYDSSNNNDSLTRKHIEVFQTLYSNVCINVNKFEYYSL